MKMCDVCGKIYDESEIPLKKSFLGSVNGVELYEDEYQSCDCGGTFVDAVRCEKCGEYVTEEEQYYGFCTTCINNFCGFETAKKIGKDNCEKVSINGFLAYVFSQKEIENILWNKLLSTGKDNIFSNAERYCKEDLIALTSYMEGEQ